MVFLDYFNPCSTRFNDFNALADFKKLSSLRDKVFIIALTALSIIFAVRTFHFLVGRFKVVNPGQSGGTQQVCKPAGVQSRIRPKVVPVDDPADGIFSTKHSSDFTSMVEKTIKEHCADGPPRGKTKTYMILGKLFQASLTTLGRSVGQAVDDGNCFLDAFRQGLSKGGTQVSVKDLRQILSREVNQLAAGPEDQNWLKQLKFAVNKTYDRFLKGIGNVGDEVSIWGRHDREGVILCQHFNVSLKIYEVAVFGGKDSWRTPDNYSCSVTRVGPTNFPTIEIGCFCNHFVSVFQS